MRAQEFLANAGIEPKVVEKPSKPPYRDEKVRDLLASASKLFAAKGKKTLKVNLKSESVSDEEIAKFLLGPTGNLRAPTIIYKNLLIVGFNED